MIYHTKGTCSTQIDLDVDGDHIIRSVAFKGGCNGNLKGISQLVTGRKAEEVIGRVPPAVSKRPHVPTSWPKH